jgi:2',3'-cyclic-nucleotide 2'-phosphodiesterase (5'-nucleotidase family)
MIHRRPESPLSRLLADIAFIMGKQWAKKNGAPIPQMALINNGGIRAHLHKGNITRRDIYEISPFENSLTILTLDGRTIKKMFDHASSRGGECLSNATLTICDNKTQSIKIDGEPLDTTKNYTIVTLDYIANGGDNYKVLRGTTQINTGKTFRDATMEYMLIRRESRKKIKAPTNQRIIIVNNNDDR